VLEPHATVSAGSAVARHFARTAGRSSSVRWSVKRGSLLSSTVRRVDCATNTPMMGGIFPSAIRLSRIVGVGTPSAWVYRPPSKHMSSG